MGQLNNFVESHLGAIGLVIFIGCVVLVLMILMLFIQSQRIKLLSGRLDYLTQGADGQSLEDVLASHLETVVRVARDLDEVAARTAVLEGAARLHFSRLGLVRFNPFDDTGGNQSFAMALLDANNDGFVISSLHSRTGTRIYAKAIFEGDAARARSPARRRRRSGSRSLKADPWRPAGAQQAEPAPSSRQEACPPAPRRGGRRQGVDVEPGQARPRPQGRSQGRDRRQAEGGRGRCGAGSRRTGRGGAPGVTACRGRDTRDVTAAGMLDP